MNALDLIAQGSMKEETPKFQIGDTVKVAVKIREGSRERIQMFEGTVIAIKGSGISKTFTVRRLSYGVGIVESVQVIRSGKVRRAKLYYLRDRVGKAAKVKENLQRDNAAKAADAE